METDENNTIRETEAEYHQRNKNVESRYLKNDKMVYLLASNTDSVNTLLESQVNDLTNILIGYKSEYDKLTRESNIKKEKTEELEKKIKALERMDEKTKKLSEEQKQNNEIMKEAIDTKKTRKQEEAFQNKTLKKQEIKLKQDILLIQKQILVLEDEQRKIDKRLSKTKMEENNIRENKNQVQFKIDDQNSKNKYEKNEQDLQLQYYETIIKQKYAFLEASDERKERQKKIAQEAKNDSQDKQEIEKRHELHLLMFYNQFLRTKMADQLKKNEKIEDIFEQIRDIVGTNDLNEIVDTILYRDKIYNYCVQRVKEEQKLKQELLKEIEELNKELTELKNDVLTKEEEEESKTVSTIPTTYIEEEEKKLIQEEKDLTKYLYDLGEKHRAVNLSYKKVLENIVALNEYAEEHPLNVDLGDEEEEEDDKVGGLHLGETEENKPTNLETQKEGEEGDERKDEENAEEKKEGEEEKKEEEKKEEEKKEEEKKEGEEGEKKEGEEGEKKEGEEGEEGEKKEGEEGEEGEKKEGEEREEKKPIELTEEEIELINTYTKWLKKSSKTFDVLFLCHSKIEFENMMRDKGLEESQVKQSSGPTVIYKKRPGRQRTTRRLVTNLSRISRITKEDIDKAVATEVKNKQEEDEESNYDPDRDILRRFMNEQKKEVQDFIRPPVKVKQAPK